MHTLCLRLYLALYIISQGGFEMHFKVYIFTAATTHKLPLQLQAVYLRVCVCVKNGKQFAIFFVL